MRIYGRYIGRVRHSILRRPYVILEPSGIPRILRTFTSIDTLLRKPSPIEELELYTADVVKGVVVDEETITAANIYKPSLPHTPICIYYINGICDYLSTAICTSVYKPNARIRSDTDISVAVRRLPGATVFTSLTGLIRRLPSVIVSTDYLAGLVKQSVIQQIYDITARVHRPYPAIEITGHKGELRALPKYSEGTEIIAEIVYKGYNELNFKGAYLVSGEALTVFNNISVLTPVNTTAQYIPQTAIVLIDLSVDENLRIVPSVELVAAHEKAVDALVALEKIRAVSRSSYTTYPFATLIGRFNASELPIVARQNIALYSEVDDKAKYTPQNVAVDTITRVLASLEILVRGRHIREHSITAYLPNIHSTAYAAVARLPHLLLLHRPILYYSIEAFYAPIVIVGFEKLLALYTFQNITRIDSSRVSIYPYTVLRSRYVIDIDVTLSLLVYEKIHELVSDATRAFRTRENLFAKSLSAYEILPYEILGGTYTTTPIPMLFPVGLESSSYDGYTFYLDIHRMLRGEFVRSAVVELSRVANIVYLTSQTLVELIKPHRVVSESSTSLTYAVPVKIAASSSVSTTAEHKYAIPIYLSLTSSSSVSSSLPYLVRYSSTSSAKASVSRAVVAVDQIAIQSAYELANLIYTAYASVSASHLTSNILSSVYGTYLLSTVGENIRHYLSASYTISTERYASLHNVYSDWVVNVIGTNVYHTTASYSEVSLVPNNAVSTAKSDYVITAVKNNAVSSSYAYYTITTAKNNAVSTVSSDYTITVYKTVNLTGSINTDSKYSIWRIATLKGTISTDSLYAIKATKSSIDVSVDVVVETSEYIR